MKVEELSYYKFDYAAIEFIEGGKRLYTPNCNILHDAKNKQRKFTDLDELGEMIFDADQEKHFK